MTKPRFSLAKAIRAVEISSEIEGQKIHKKKAVQIKQVKKTEKTDVKILTR